MKSIIKNILFLIGCLSGLQIHAQTHHQNDSVATDSIATVMLDEINITASRITDTPTGYRMRVAGSKLAKGKDTSSLLSFLPNVSHEEGAVLINGLPATEITVDGRKVYDLSELKEIPAEAIQSVEVRYIAGASKITDSAGGTLAIRLKPAPKNGFYGTLQGTGGFSRASGPEKGVAFGSISSRIGRVSLYESLSANAVRVKDMYDNITVSDGLSDSRSMETSIRHDIFRNVTALSTDVANGHSMSLNWTLSWLRSRTDDGLKDCPFLDLKASGRDLSNTIGLSYSGDLGPKAGVLAVSAEWLNRRHRRRQEILSGDVPYSTPDYRNTSDLYKFSAEWSRSLGHGHSLSAGISDDIAGVRTSLNDLMADPDGANEQKILVNTSLLSASAQGRFGRVGYSAGIGWQQSRTRIDGKRGISVNAPIPSLQISVPLDQGARNSLILMYRHSLDNIPYDAMSEKEVWMDANSYSVGNRDLRPRQLDYASIMASLLGGSISFSGDVIKISDQIQWETFSDPRFLSVTYTKPVNISRPYWNYSLEAEYNRTFFGCWTLKGSAWISFNKEDGDLGGVRYNDTRFRQNYRLLNSLTLQRGWGGFVDAHFEPTFRNFDRTYHSVWRVDCRVYKAFLKGDLYVWLDMTPCGNRRRLDRMSADRKVTMRYTTPVQAVSLSVQYRFRGGKKDISVRTGQTSVGYNEISDSK